MTNVRAKKTPHGSLASQKDLPQIFLCSLEIAIAIHKYVIYKMARGYNFLLW
jgi:hypothetical protein